MSSDKDRNSAWISLSGVASSRNCSSSACVDATTLTCGSVFDSTCRDSNTMNPGEEFVLFRRRRKRMKAATRPIATPAMMQAIATPATAPSESPFEGRPGVPVSETSDVPVSSLLGVLPVDASSVLVVAISVAASEESLGCVIYVFVDKELCSSPPAFDDVIVGTVAPAFSMLVRSIGVPPMTSEVAIVVMNCWVFPFTNAYSPGQPVSA